MIASATIASVISTYGIAILAPLAVLEGPIVTIVAAYLASLGPFTLWQVILCVIIADVVGDAILYGVGRGMLDWLSESVRARVGVSDARLGVLAQTFQDNGVQVLVIGKLTHAAGFAVLIGAGAARMPFIRFVLANLAATIPKSLALVAVGYLFGGAHAVIAEWFSVGSIVLLSALAGTFVVWRIRKSGMAA